MKRLIAVALLATAMTAHALEYGVWGGQSGWVKRSYLSHEIPAGAIHWSSVLAVPAPRSIDADGLPCPMGAEEQAARAAAPYCVFESDHWREMTEQERADYDAAIEAADYPEPAAVIAELDAETGEPTGRTFRQYVIDGEVVVVLNSASPPRPWQDQKADFVANAARLKKAADDAGKVATTSASANSVPALRAEVAKLAAIVRQLAGEGD